MLPGEHGSADVRRQPVQPAVSHAEFPMRAPLQLSRSSDKCNVLMAFRSSARCSAGKSTQCQMVSEELGWSHISAGDLLRAQVAAGTEVVRERFGAVTAQATHWLCPGSWAPTTLVYAGQSGRSHNEGGQDGPVKHDSG